MQSLYRVDNNHFGLYCFYLPEYILGFENNNLFADADVVYYYFNLYNLFSSTSGDEKAVYKKRLIKDYFKLSKKVDDDSMDPSTGENLNYYFDFVQPFSRLHQIFGCILA